MRLRFFLIFVVAFVLIFAVLNSRFIYANAKFWLLTGQKFPPSPVKSGAAPAAPEAKPLPDKAMLGIEKVGLSAPIIFGLPDNNRVLYGGLEQGVVHYSATPKPGERGVSIILGHSSAYPWYKGAYGSVFALLGKLSIGDRIYVKYDDGQTFVFSVKQTVIFSPFKENTQLTQIEKSDKPTIVLISCWPIGTDYKRIAVVAELN
jgi:LPXTG-site transpeptidase (sortase) family protein